jgi:hypothetical protein
MGPANSLVHQIANHFSILLTSVFLERKSVIDQAEDSKPYFRFFNLSRTEFKKSLTLLPY